MGRPAAGQQTVVVVLGEDAGGCQFMRKGLSMFTQFQGSLFRSAIIAAGRCLMLVALVSPLGLAYGQGKPADKDKDLVKAEAHLSVDRLPAGDKCQILIRLTIQPEWHIGANPALDETGYATKVEWKAKLGTKLTQLKYPPGKKFTPEEGTVQLVYDGKTDIRGTLEIPASAGGMNEEVEIIVHYQACNDKICRIPTTARLVAKLPVARPGDAVKPQNEPLFAPPK